MMTRGTKVYAVRDVTARFFVVDGKIEIGAGTEGLVIAHRDEGLIVQFEGLQRLVVVPVTAIQRSAVEQQHIHE